MNTFEWTVQLTVWQQRIIKLVRVTGVVFLFAGMAIATDLNGFASAHGLEDDSVRKLFSFMIFIAGIAIYSALAPLTKTSFYMANNPITAFRAMPTPTSSSQSQDEYFPAP